MATHQSVDLVVPRGIEARRVDERGQVVPCQRWVSFASRDEIVLGADVDAHVAGLEPGAAPCRHDLGLRHLGQTEDVEAAGVVFTTDRDRQLDMIDADPATG